MRIAALFLGLMAGLLALLAPIALRVDLLSPFLEFWAASANERLLGTMVWYAIAGAALLGGILAIITPGFAALLLIGAAVGWLAIAVTVPQLLTYHLLAPAGAAGLGAVFAFLAGELQVRRRRMARRNRKLAMDTIGDDTNGEIEREAALRMEPILMPRENPPPPPKRPIPLTLSDVTVTSRPANDPPRWQDLDPPQPPPRRRDPDIWAEARREPVSFAEEMPAARQAAEPIAEAHRVAEPRPEPPERRWDPEQPRSEPHRRRAVTRSERGRVWVAALAAVGAVLGLGIIAAGGYLLNRDGSLQALFGPPPAPVVVAADDLPPETAASAQPTKVELPTPPAIIKFPKIPTKSATAAPTAAGQASPPSEVVEPTSTAPSRVAAAPAPEGYDEPFSYCRAVGTIDYVDHRYAGPAVTEAMTRALLIPATSPRDRVRWRCFEGAVLACTSYAGPICDTAPTVIEMREFCERNPNVDQLLAPSGPWSCADGQPQLPADASWPVDERGFLPQGWIKVPDPLATPAG